MTIEAWFFPAAIALLLNGVTTFLPKLSLQRLGFLDIAVYHCCFFFVAAVAIQPFYSDARFDIYGVLIAVSTGIIGTLGQILYLVALQRGPVAYVSMISSLYPLVATLLAFLLLGEPLTPRQLLGVGLGIFSIILLVRAHEKQP